MSVELSNSPTTLIRWQKIGCSTCNAILLTKRISAKQTGSFPGNGKVILSETEQELVRLRKELHNTQHERDILKRLSAFSLGMMANIPVHNESR